VSRPQLVLVRLWPWLLALLVLGPLLGRGYVLTYDMVFVPDLAMRSDFLGCRERCRPTPSSPCSTR
jgi:hypothetical protein